MRGIWESSRRHAGASAPGVIPGNCIASPVVQFSAVLRPFQKAVDITIRRYKVFRGQNRKNCPSLLSHPNARNGAFLFIGAFAAVR